MEHIGDKCHVKFDELTDIINYLENALKVDQNKKQQMWKKMKTDVINYDINRNQSYTEFMTPDMIDFLDSIKL